jgi:hypothetical protein
MQRHNQRLYRIARAVTCNDSEAEDVVQGVYEGANFSSLLGFSTGRCAHMPIDPRSVQNPSAVDLTAGGRAHLISFSAILVWHQYRGCAVEHLVRHDAESEMATSPTSQTSHFRNYESSRHVVRA